MRIVPWAAIVVPLILARHLSADSTATIESQAPGTNVALYDSDPNHLWNRLHAALYTRKYLDGRQAGQDEVDPLIWHASRHILAGPPYRQAIGTLDEFLSTDGQTLIKDPVKRAVLQHDLWAIFDWLADDFAQPTQDEDRYRDERHRLQNRLAQALRQVALDTQADRNVAGQLRHCHCRRDLDFSQDSLDQCDGSERRGREVRL
jgi:hypothetical protein